ncbi:MAG: DNA cytosine methyltransferase [Verrucomicrobia bacterium]|nr:DNA cytosine methyltransferase [Verrucomicrobiota bacterium]
MDTPKTITHIGLCAGYGGIELGLHRFIRNLRTVALCEIEAFACANLVAKMEAGLLDPAPLWTDIKTFPCEEFRDRVGLLVAGYPCQPFSAAGKRLGAEDPRHLWPHILGAIRIIRPRLCFFENVEGHISLGLREVLGDLGAAGYTAAWGIFSASEVGAPHQRKRVFILAYRNESGWQARWHNAISSQWRQPHELAACGGDQGGAEELAYRKCEGLERFYNGNTSAEPSEHVGADAWTSGECGPWPSRPGEQQHAWEPPRVVGAVPAKLANFCSRDSQQGRDTAQAGGESISAWRKNEDAMPHSRSSVCGGDQGDEQAMGNSIMHGHASGEITGGTGAGEGKGRVQKPSGGSGAMGNASQRQDHGRESRDLGLAAGEGRCGNDAVDGTSEGMGNATEPRCEWSRGPNDSGWPPPEPNGSCTHGAMESKQRQTQPPLGRDADGPADWVDYAELCVSCDNRTDELRLLGNGVVPATAARAFRVLWHELINQ